MARSDSREGDGWWVSFFLCVPTRRSRTNFDCLLSQSSSQTSSIRRSTRFTVMSMRKTNCSTHSHSKASRRLSIEWRRRIASRTGSNHRLSPKRRSMRWNISIDKVLSLQEVVQFIHSSLCCSFSICTQSLERLQEEDSGSSTISANVTPQRPIPGHISSLRAAEQEQKKTTTKDASRKHIDPFTGEWILNYFRAQAEQVCVWPAISFYTTFPCSDGLSVVLFLSSRERAGSAVTDGRTNDARQWHDK